MFTLRKTEVLPYKKYSRSAKALAAGLGIQPMKSKTLEYLSIYGFQPEHDCFMVNWGFTGNSGKLKLGMFEDSKYLIINEPRKVLQTSNKFRFFETVKPSTRIPEYTSDKSTALEWVADGHLVFGRSVNGSGGTDIVKSTDDDKIAFLDSDFWTKYKKKKQEYRIHIAFGNIIDEQQKVLRQVDEEGNPIDKSEIDFSIRNHSNGFIFQKNGLSIPDDVRQQAMNAYMACGLDFAAFDVIFNEHEGRAYVLEANTAPGLEGSTVNSYVEAFKQRRKEFNSCA